MRKLKIPVLILITIALLAVGATLPAIAAAVQDQAVVNHSSFGDMESLKLDFSDPGATPLLQKLTLIRDGSFYTVSPSKTRIRQSEIEQLVKEGLALYYQDELIPYNWQKYEFSALPHLVYSNADQDTYAIFWVVDIRWPETEGYLSLYLDDETGLILYLHYGTASALDVYTAQEYLDALSNAFFASTGLSDILADPEEFGVEWVMFDDAGVYEKNDKYYVHTIHHPDYGVLEIQFWVYQNGFYTSIR